METNENKQWPRPPEPVEKAPEVPQLSLAELNVLIDEALNRQ